MNRLKQLRIENKESQKNIAELLGTSEGSISHYETGRRDIPNRSQILLAKHFGVSIDYLMGFSDIRNPIDINSIQFANNGGLDVNGLSEFDIEELQAQIECKRKLNEIQKRKEQNL